MNTLTVANSDNMQSIKQEVDSIEPYSGEDALVLALQGASRDMMGQKISANPFKAKTSCRRKREFIPEEKKDNLYWERRRKNNEAAKRSREKRRINDMVLENKLMALGEENASLKAELLSLKLKFGLVSLAAYAQEVKNLSSSANIDLYQEYVPPRAAQSSSSRVLEPHHSRSSCISVIKHSPHMPETCTATQGSFSICGTADVKQEPTENASYAQERSSPYELYRNYMANPSSGVFSQQASFLQLTRSSSNSPRSSDDSAVSKSSDGEDEQQVPKGPTPSSADPRSVIVSTHKVPDAGSSALPHKLRIKARTVQIKVEAVDPEYESPRKSSSPFRGSEGGRCQTALDSYNQSSPCPLSLQVTNMQDWTHQSEQWHKSSTETQQNGYQSSTSPVSHKTLVDVKELSYAGDLFLPQGLADPSAKGFSLKRPIAALQGSVIESTKTPTHQHEPLSKGGSFA
ncbi:nuclear factor interleukin-3-regulated protein [Anoplopoma fimbria]|uniref:nuclear factor interleukin-3-regulated protein n=1 Tax=Anoplopoma fimbria TaxID=229290 RepID=UPI0023EA7CF8|nr:nuclear factor interleukin-3-regulated protein [Anoplopoma fimbria]XP_054468234.1 nuclear factor interleukin-3-regulated protein [Anoplopoma fimbria]XP_054468235.1 nuclear factor interleukin-3-regulated protein [Anoplopoma fimbria]XP_054468236.1 nuclear factor interleukin-3-regulated protein [Anoplopoma fimbria]XP_054468237.1 nuclear factor interleukin-3-regulated protein [Anoplopoma fimbria]